MEKGTSGNITFYREEVDLPRILKTKMFHPHCLYSLNSDEWLAIVRPVGLVGKWQIVSFLIKLLVFCVF